MRKSILHNLWLSVGNSFDPMSLLSKFAGWWKDEGNPNYLVDQIGYQEREVLTQNAISGQLFPGRAKVFTGATQRAVITDNGALDIGSNSAFSLAFWIKWDSFATFSRVLGKIINTSTAGEYYLTTGSVGLVFAVRGTGGIVNASLIGTVATGTWYHLIATIDTSQVLRCYVDKVLTGGTQTITGTIPSIPNTTGFGINTATSIVSGTGTGHTGTIQVRDLRIFKGKVLSADERSACFAGNFVSGFTEWYPLSDSSTTRLHSAKSGGLHATAVGATTTATGFWRQLYNLYGYAEDATYGQIPPDMTNLTGEVPVNDCYGNALVFKGSAKQNLTKSGGNYTMFASAQSDQLQTLIQSCDVVALNQWWSGNTPQAISIASVGVYDASRQFYNSSEPELIIIKADSLLDSYNDITSTQGVVDGEYLTASEEVRLMSYLSNPIIPTSYHADTVTFVTRFTNSYTDKEKSRIDNVWRLLNRTGVKTKLEGLVIAATSGLEEQKLDWVNASYNVVDASLGEVDQVPYYGLAAQKGNFKNGFVPSSGVGFTQNNAFTSFKVAIDNRVPSQSNRFFGSENIAVSLVSASFSFGPTGALKRSLSTSVNTATPTVVGLEKIETNRTFISNRTGASAGNIVAKRRTISTVTTTSAARNAIEFYLGNNHSGGGNRYISYNNYIQHLAWGASLSSTESQQFALIVDTFCNGQSALASEWIQETGFRYKLENKVFIDRLGEQCLWSDFENLYYSTDGGTTVAATVAFNSITLGWIHMAHIFDDGKIILGTSKNKFYKTTTALGTPTEIIPTKNGLTYTPHTPVSATYPGEYTKFLGIKQKQYLGDGTEIFVYNNYGTSLRGPSAAIVWYSFGDEMKVAYEFGTNPYLRDNGTANGSTTGTLLGDATITEWVRHGHGVQQRPDDKTKFISAWGDLDRAALAPIPGAYQECQGWEHVYNQGADTWTHTKLWTSGQSARGKSTSIQMPGDGFIYLTSDAGVTGSNDTELGYFKVAYADVGTLANWTRFYTPLDLSKPSNMFHLDSDGRFVGGGYAATGVPSGGFFGPANIIWSDDMVNFNEVKLKLPGDVYCYKITKISTNKYQMDWMNDYDYYLNSYSVILEFN